MKKPTINKEELEFLLPIIERVKAVWDTVYVKEVKFSNRRKKYYWYSAKFYPNCPDVENDVAGICSVIMVDILENYGFSSLKLTTKAIKVFLRDALNHLRFIGEDTYSDKYVDGLSGWWWGKLGSGHTKAHLEAEIIPRKVFLDNVVSKLKSGYYDT